MTIEATEVVLHKVPENFMKVNFVCEFDLY